MTHVKRPSDLDCQSSTCKFAREKSGMRHNGPCKCVENLLTDYATLQRTAETLEKALQPLVGRYNGVALSVGKHDEETDTYPVYLTGPDGYGYGATAEFYSEETAKLFVQIIDVARQAFPPSPASEEKGET